jgi:DNA adenine methylase
MKPLLKWVGGKTQILDNIAKRFPEKMENYHEIFVGGGSVLLKVIEMKKRGDIEVPGNIYAYDKNKNLIHFYKTIQRHPKDIFEAVKQIYDTYSEITGKKIERKPKTIEEAKTSRESYYYWVRQEYNKGDSTQVQKAAMFLFLNKMCFRGLYREGPNGFNVPYGHYKSVPNMNESEFMKMSEYIKDVIFCESDFNESMKKVKKGDCVYLDPPYAPEKKGSFVGYTADGFVNHEELFKEMERLKKEKVKVLMSNAKVNTVTDFFGKEWKCDDIDARRAIHSKNPASRTVEVLVYAV